jgi:hypothetical protein
MEKDPRSVLQSFEVDENECILEYKPKNKKGKKTGPAPLSNTAILSLCLMTGLSAGIGSAFIENVKAETKLEVPVKAPVVDEPIAKPEVKAEVPLPAEPKVNEEVIPNTPPLDQPVTSGVKMQTSKVKEEKHEKEERAEKKEEGKKTEKKEQKQSQVTNHYSLGSQAKSQTTPVKQNRNIQTKHITPSKPHSSVRTNHDSSPQKSGKTEHSQQTKLAAGPKWQPKTEQGGKLPVTAGNDLNGALLGGAVAALGALYHGKRRKAEQE